MSDGFRLEKSDDGLTLVATGPWNSEMDVALNSGRVDGLDLNYAQGFKDTDLGFLRSWPLKRVTLLARTVTDLEPIYKLAASLESLRVQSAPSARIDLRRLPLVNALSADWGQIRDSIAEALQLRDLFVHGYTEPDLGPLGGLSLLERVRMKERPAVSSLDGLDALHALTHLGIYLARHLDNIEALHRVNDRLEVLHLESCRAVGDFEPISGCSALRIFNASDCDVIESLAPLATLGQLEAVWLYGTTRVRDGDLSPLADLVRLRELRMASRGDYHPTVENIQAVIAARSA